MTVKKVLTTGKAAKYCQVSPVTIYNWIRAGKLEAYKTAGGQYRIEPEVLVDFMEKHGMPIPKVLSPFLTKRILIVTDDSITGNVVCQALQQSGFKYQLKSARNVFETAIQALQFQPDLIIIDLVTERFSGVEIVEQIRQEPKTQESKILVITNGNVDENIESILRAGTNGSLHLPLHAETVKEELCKLFKDTSLDF